MQLGWKITSSLLALFFAFFAYFATKLTLIDELGPGPGLFPLFMGCVGVVLSIILIMQVTSGSLELPEETDAAAPNSWRRLLSVIILLGAAAIMLEPLGYRIAALFMVPLVLVVLGARSILAIVLVSLGMSAGVFHVFYHWLGVPLPVGFFGI